MILWILLFIMSYSNKLIPIHAHARIVSNEIENKVFSCRKKCFSAKINSAKFCVTLWRQCTHRLLLADNSLWLRRAPCFRRWPPPDTVSDLRNLNCPFARPETRAGECRRRRCCSPRRHEEACYPTHCARSCPLRRRASGPNVARGCCGKPFENRRLFEIDDMVVGVLGVKLFIGFLGLGRSICRAKFDFFACFASFNCLRNLLKF